MPKPGFKSITVKQEIYDYFFSEYQKMKDEYRLKHGITSFSGFITKRLYELMNLEEPVIPKPTLKHFNLDEKGVLIQDAQLKDRMPHVYFKPDKIFCDYCETDDCKHVEFARGLPQVQKILKKKGWKLS